MSPYVIGLTGNIATGKSTIARMLQQLGAQVLDADQLSRWVQRAGTDVHRSVVQRFGPAIVGADGEIDRAALGSIVFADPRALADLEALVHPAVIAETERWLAAVSAPVAVIEAIKLLEAGMGARCDAIWVVTSPSDLQEQRLRTTRGLDQAQARARIAAQPPQADKVRLADTVIDNSGTLEDAWRQVLHAWNSLLGVGTHPQDTPYTAPAKETPRRPSRAALWRAVILAAAMGLLVLLFGANAGLSSLQRLWFTFLGMALGLACSWMIGLE
ncbi:MAG: dephospho-CoA kinase [Chloroflexi bacterium]|nr:dephospho-CoA kinase [Chloroflexota bacterium]